MEPKKDSSNHTCLDARNVRVTRIPKRGVASQEVDLRRPNLEGGFIKGASSGFGTRDSLCPSLQSTERWRRVDSKARTFIRE